MREVPPVSDPATQPTTARPTEFTFLTRILPGQTANIVELTLATVVGPISVYADPKTAIDMGKQLLNAGKSAATGLVLPPSTNGHGVLLDKDE